MTGATWRSPGHRDSPGGLVARPLQDRAWQGLAMLCVGALLVVLRSSHLWLYSHGDKGHQYVPVLRDMGRRLREGDFPALDPALGPSGNYAIDTQYGLFDPLHLATAYLLSFVEDPYVAGWLVSVPFLLVMAWGTTALLQRLGVHGVWSAAGGVGSATSGYVFFQLATSWWPGLVGAAFLPWVWWAWQGEPRVRRLVGIALFTFLVVSSGWPSAWLAYAMLVAGLLAEFALRPLESGRPRDWTPFGARVLAAGAGVVLGAVNLVAILRASAWTVRETEIYNQSVQTPNLADVVAFAVPYLHGDITSYNQSATISAPLFFSGWFLLAIAWLTAWRAEIWRAPGVVTAAVGLGLALVSTQLPSDLGPIRVHVRQLAAVQLFALVFVLLAWRRSPARVSRPRVVGVLVSYAAMTVLAWSRTPQDGEVLWGALAGLVALGVLLLAPRWGGLAAAGAVALVGTTVLTAVATFLEYPTGEPEVQLRSGPMSMQPAESPGFTVLEKESATERNSWVEQGVGWGLMALTSDNRYAPGYSSVAQRNYADVVDYRGAGKLGPRAARGLFEREAVSGARWIELLGYRVVVVARSRVESFERAADETWRPVASSEDFVKYAPVAGDGLTPDQGRVTAVLGDVRVAAREVGAEDQAYTVATDTGGRLVMRDLYWPGYTATIDGEPVPVTPFEGTLVSVALPPGADGVLEVQFRAQTPTTLAATLGSGAGLLVLSVALLVLGRRRTSGSPRRRVLGIRRLTSRQR